jgi:AAA15 family ATPase/GTPase
MSDTEDKRLILANAHLKGFKSIEDLTIEFKPDLNILIGKNGSGKSNFLEFLNAAVLSMYSKDKRDFKYAQVTFLANDNHTFKYNIERNNIKPALNEELLEEDLYRQTLYFDDELIFDTTDEEPKRFFMHGNKRILTGRQVYNPFMRLGYRHIRPLYIRYEIPKGIPGVDMPGTVRIPLDEDFMDWEFNTHSRFLFDALFDMSTNFADKVYESSANLEDEDIEKLSFEAANGLTTQFMLDNAILNEGTKHDLATFSPVKDVRINKNIGLFKDEDAVLFDNIQLEFFVNESWQPWSQLSDGTKRIFNIIADVTHKTSGIILIEEPELGIHPAQFHLLMHFLKEQAEDKQIIISTHSPKALDILDPDTLDHILIASYKKGTGTSINRMTETQTEKAKKYMKELFLSDFWLMSDLEDDD